MCGIVGYIGYREAEPILINGLKRLEYRGYDSAGIAILNEKLQVYKTKGKVADLENLIDGKDLHGTIGMAHTRWATHGEPSDINAHPHFSQNDELALIHNGIIENYTVIRDYLIQYGYQFRSNTDTEVLIQLIHYIKKTSGFNLVQAVQAALNHVIGAWAIVVMDKNNPDTLIAARKGSPLVIGIGNDEFFLASDASPIIEFTHDVVFLNDEEIAIIQRGENLRIRTIKDVEKNPLIQKLELNIHQLEKGGYEHFMLKEIFEQPDTIKDCMRGRISEDNTTIAMAGIIDNIKRFMEARRIIITAAGTSWHAGLVGEYMLEDLAHIPVEVEYSSEFRYRNPVIYPDDIVIAISQSGETADTIAAIQMAKQKGAFLYGICNVVGSSIARYVDAGSYTHAGPEIGVASTKAFTAQVTVLALMALALGQKKGTISNQKVREVLTEMETIPDKVRQILDKAEMIRDFSKVFTYARNFLYLGRGYNFPVALEGALKLKEISYIHAEGYPAAEMKHGPIALIDQEMPVVVVATNRGTYEKVISNIEEVKSRKGRIISVITEGDTRVRKLSDYYIEIPETEEMLVPILATIPLQLMAYYIAVLRGCNVDQPRNLAKSVTVE
ncbi:MAG TPA: glutamine--fructose-6-phosphate transaminase (isomerizing) [Bacteroidales bacterium]|jgi:glucosamine--fructose-6-phosphate aminotransferase (isomerizing)|nr:glutamine--fructose-6-phosphate transaminase (isomerizing) [Bacteroidales bacterium]MDI9573134.1 glutamine--fructose-6-phosphate transaminase (isomerizing) [Bacteroidota bacterium]OQC60242.1 MAG: Glutamine--fructose-6-phosphate aminotransferase (isomerizing) [Bacteroidetes bacterium ADurb.Bin012]MBP9511549.1 glutamine--fructose-6-phosphate transaminase (isomerizing) [Bacteroidales bacterium]MBP9588246.1 glutamine--fructose-6-phosphate transaminase (isomerizing) [Bacteroidales bacterium]